MTRAPHFDVEVNDYGTTWQWDASLEAYVLTNFLGRGSPPVTVRHTDEDRWLAETRLHQGTVLVSSEAHHPSTAASRLARRLYALHTESRAVLAALGVLKD